MRVYFKLSLKDYHGVFLGPVSLRKVIMGNLQIVLALAQIWGKNSLVHRTLNPYYTDCNSSY